MNKENLIENEGWKNVPEWPGYQVSDQGRVRSCKDIRGNLTPDWHFLEGDTRRNRRRVILSVGNGNHKSFFVHRLVLLAFVGLPPDGNVCRHLDGNPTNNKLSNLCWGTMAENGLDDVRNGVHKGVKHHQAKLNDGDVVKIRKMRKCNVTEVVLAKMFGVSRECISAIVTRATWSHIGTEEEVRNYRKGEWHHKAVLTTETVIKIRQMLAQGITCAEISRRLNIKYGAIDNVKHGRTWKHVE